MNPNVAWFDHNEPLRIPFAWLDDTFFLLNTQMRTSTTAMTTTTEATTAIIISTGNFFFGAHEPDKHGFLSSSKLYNNKINRVVISNGNVSWMSYVLQ